MKKNLVLLLISAILLPLILAGCKQTEPPKTDVWDGSVATSFEGGDGSKKNPFMIKTVAQLAFLASEVNSGKDFSGKHVSLASNLDLNYLEWTPIGNGTYSFNGIFDGNNLLIKNLKISKGACFVSTDISREHNRYVTGLFGSCVDAIIKNLMIDQAEITITDVADQSSVIAGVLAGDVLADSHTEISNIRISNAQIIGDFVSIKPSMGLVVGGCCGFVLGRDASSCDLSQIQTDVSVSIEYGKAADNSIGGLSGFLFVRNEGVVKNCVSKLSVEIDADKSYNLVNSFGAFGNFAARHNTVSVVNLFSKVKVNMIHDYFHGYPAYTAHALAGVLDPGVRENGGYNLKNVFGYVEQVDDATGERVISTKLHDCPYSDIYTETNCHGCKALPENHGFDKKVWDLTDLSNPKLK